MNWLWTKRAGEGAKLNIGDFTSTRWKAAQKKFLNNQFAVLTLRVDALLQLAARAWNGTPGGPAYGYGHLANSLARTRWDIMKPKPPDALWPWESIKPPVERLHAVPIAYTGDSELNLSAMYVHNAGIKGAFWANFLSPVHVALAGGEAVLRQKLNGIRIDGLAHGGLLIVATDSPLPEDTEATRERFWRLDDALQPAFISHEGLPQTFRDMLGYFYRERPPMR